ncbi:hypothetical protein [Alkaliphilus metalliredigens]|uniref:hypothetical protein n=1 Tax=Alkaliphilus metalliredigens TaxID=208226 RepID=UPI0005A29A37|nr:hypothetical protein [Alkaliphilus metalliredigens]
MKYVLKLNKMEEKKKPAVIKNAGFMVGSFDGLVSIFFRIGSTDNKAIRERVMLPPPYQMNH